MNNGKKLLDYEFEYVQELAPVKDINGKIKLFYPERSYKNLEGLSLHQYGEGHFCRFSINPKWSAVSGVYSFFINDNLCYIGQCLDLCQRFNSGYGVIAPRNCYEGGQSTNCKMNKVVLGTYQHGKTAMLYFYTTTDFDRVEYELIQYYKPQYNVSRTGVNQAIPKTHNPSIETSPAITRSSVNSPIWKNASKQSITAYIQSILDNARRNGNRSIVLVSGEIHKALALSNCMPTVCNAMYSLLKQSDTVLKSTPSGFSSTITIEYKL